MCIIIEDEEPETILGQDVLWSLRIDVDRQLEQLATRNDDAASSPVKAEHEEILEHVAAQGILLAINQLKQHWWNPTIMDYEVLLSWKGLESIETRGNLFVLLFAKCMLLHPKTGC
ncbi:hypothetical protein GQ600_16115 [Phytophthora cactorum]|nr:hypothetical protein GQ600_16115 [Phytophthora cactorum]